MRIIFNLTNVGLGNNGGSLTIIKSANILQELGQDVIILDSQKNQNKWVKLNVPHLIVSNNSKIPSSDIIIGTGFNSWNHTLSLSKKNGKKYIWLRGWETWQTQENNLIQILSSKKLNILTNSIGLKNYINQFKIESEVIRPGYDFEDFYPMNFREKNKDEIILGGLYHRKHKTKRSDWIFQAYEILKNKYSNLKLFMFGFDQLKEKEIDYYLKQPNLKEKNELFNSVDIWLSPSCLEGLHIVPAEYLLTEGALVSNDSPLSGTMDYAIHKQTSIVSKNDFNSFIKSIEILILNKELRIELGKNGKNKIFELGDRKTNMQKMINLTSKKVK